MRSIRECLRLRGQRAEAGRKERTTDLVGGEAECRTSGRRRPRETGTDDTVRNAGNGDRERASGLVSEAVPAGLAPSLARGGTLLLRFRRLDFHFAFSWRLVA